MIVLQVLAVAAAAIPLALFARELGVGARNANLLAIAYLLSPAAQGLGYDNFSENAFVPLLAFGAALAVRRRSFWPALIAAALLMGLKEDQILFVLWFGAACALVVGPAHRARALRAGRGERRGLRRRSNGHGRTAERSAVLACDLRRVRAS